LKLLTGISVSENIISSSHFEKAFRKEDGVTWLKKRREQYVGRAIQSQ
jgi:hypothetical protein